jgi:hypothetical protein
MFSQKLIHDGGRRVNKPCNTCRNTCYLGYLEQHNRLHRTSEHTCCH